MKSTTSRIPLRPFGWPIALLSLVIVAGCGGGGGGGSSGSSGSSGGNSAPAPVVNFSASSSSVATGATVTLTWSSSNATSCSASVSAGNADFSGTKTVSGTEDVAVAYGTNTFKLSCTVSGGSSSKSVTVEGTQLFNESAFVPLGQTKTYKGFVFNSQEGSAGCLASIEMDLTNNDNFLNISNYSANEWRYIAFREQRGLSLGSNYATNEGDEPGTFYSIPISNSALNGIDVSEVNIDPYTFEASTLEDLEQYSANISLDVDVDLDVDNIYYGGSGGGYYCNPDMEMGLLAFPNTSTSETDSAFIGTSDRSDGYTFLWMVQKDYWDSHSDNLPTEYDIFSINWGELDVYTSYMSSPLIVKSDYGFRVNQTIVEDIWRGGDSWYYWQAETIIGSRTADSTYVATNGIYYGGGYIIKYLYPVDDSWSTQRIFLKADSYYCFQYYTSCNLGNYELLFFDPNKEGLMGFKLGGYNGTTEISNVKIIYNNN